MSASRELQIHVYVTHIILVCEAEFLMEEDKEEAAAAAGPNGREKKKNTQHRFSSCHLSSALSVRSRLGVKLEEGSDTYTEQEGEERVNQADCVHSYFSLSPPSLSFPLLSLSFSDLPSCLTGSAVQWL